MTEGTERQVRTVWIKEIQCVEDAFYVGAVIYRFASYLLDCFSKLQPDFDRLKKWIMKLAKDNKVNTSKDCFDPRCVMY